MFTLDKQGKPKRCNNTLKWGRWMQEIGKGRIVEQTNIGKVMVSTVFLGLDHSFGSKIPVLWETMIFGSKRKALAGYQERYTSLSGAKKGHKLAIKFVESFKRKVK